MFDFDVEYVRMKEETRKRTEDLERARDKFLSNVVDFKNKEHIDFKVTGENGKIQLTTRNGNALEITFNENMTYDLEPSSVDGAELKSQKLSGLGERELTREIIKWCLNP